jgi:phosphoribosylaminoimidazolecarboxamide formyltransferase/IMP cyclohydrolase
MQLEITQQYAIISVYYKELPGFDRLVRALHKAGVLIISTGKTAEYIRGLGILVIEVADLTKFPEMMRGRLKTIHPRVFGGILGERDQIDDIKKMQEHGIPFINYVIVNFYPFEEEVAKGKDTTHEQIIEKIDIGGPAMVRAAGKNHERVVVICHPDDYEPLAKMLEEGQEITLEQREFWLEKAFGVTGRYDLHVEKYMKGRRLAREAAKA